MRFVSSLSSLFSLTQLFLVDSTFDQKIFLIPARRFNVPDDASPDVVSIVSHAAQEYLKTLAEKLGVIAEHRLETFKVRN